MFRKNKEEIKSIIYATDLHGATIVFKKFISAAIQYKTNLAILGGDVSGKLLFPILKNNDDTYTFNYYGQKINVKNNSELQEYTNKIEFEGNYYKIMDRDEYERIINDKNYMFNTFKDLIVQRLKSWIDYAESKLSPYNIPILISGGNDDEKYVIDTITSGSSVKNVDNKIYSEFTPFIILNVGYSNRTPFNTPREMEENELESFLDSMLSKYGNDREHLILNVHVPPYGTSLDLAPKVMKKEDGELSIELKGGQPEMVHVGSIAVRRIIEKYQPALGLFGHIHENRVAEKIGNTLCINPGSSYNEGTLNFVIIRIRDNKILSHQLLIG
ncbi:MAG: hypothetical protein ACP5G5_07535 [Thermoplasmata archaeon]